MSNEEFNFVFEDDKDEIDTSKLISNTNTEFDFNKTDWLYKNRATKPKNLTKKQKKTRSKIAKSSRRRNRH